jgi:hypothetical protein
MNWTKNRRFDRDGLVEFVCEHGCGHPAYGSALFIAEAICAKYPDRDVDKETSTQLVHGCCGCCSRDDFPGTPVASLKHAHTLIRGYLRRIDELEERLSRCLDDLEEAHE